MRKILGRITSINVRKVLWTADELGLPCEREDWGLPIRDPNVPEFLALNPNGLVPVLVEDGFVLWESNAIMGYLTDGGAGASLIPAAPRSRALMAQWLTWQATELAPTWGYAFRGLVWRSPEYMDEARIADSIARWTARMAILEGQFRDGRAYIVGGSFSLADIALALAAHRWFSTPFKKPDYATLEAYYHRVRQRPAAAQYLGEGTP